MSRSRSTRQDDGRRPRPTRDWFDDEIIEADEPRRQASVDPAVPHVQETYLRVVDAYGCPVRRQIGFRRRG